MKNMQVIRKLGLIILAALFIVSCSSTGSETVYSPGPTATEREEILEQQRALAEERARRQEEAEARRIAEEQAAREAAMEAERRAEAERVAQARQRQEAEETARREAQRQRDLAARRAEEQARVVAAQQARIEELRAQIAANENETQAIEAANAALGQAVAAAEQLTQALTEEEEKYNNTDPVTGEPREALATTRLQELAEEVESLSNQAESLLAQP